MISKQVDVPGVEVVKPAKPVVKKDVARKDDTDKERTATTGSRVQA